MELGKAFVTIEADNKLAAGLAAAEGQVRKSTEAMTAKLKTIGAGMTLVGGALTAGFALAIKNAAGFEASLADVSTMLDEGAMKLLPGYASELKTLAVDFGEGTSTLSKGLYDILSASIDPTKALDVLAVSAKAASAGVTDTGTAADAITTILNSFGMEADNAATVSDKLFQIVKAGKLTFPELASSIGRVASTAAMSGLSFDELGAAVATLTRAGISSEQSMTAVNGIIQAFLKPTTEAVTAAGKFGIELTSNTLKTEGLSGVMAKLKDATAEELAQIFPTIEGLKGMSAALGDAEGFTANYNSMLESAGATQDAFGKQSETLNFKMNQMKEGLGLIGTTIGEVLIPAMKPLIDKAVELAKSFKTWAEENPKLLDGIVKVAAAIGAICVVGGPILMAVAAFSGLAGAIGLIFSPIGLVIAAVAGLAIAWKTNFLGIRDITKSVWEFVKDVFDKLVKFISDSFERLKKIIAAIKKVVAELVTAAVEGITVGPVTGEGFGIGGTGVKPYAGPTPSLQHGTPYIPKTGLYQLHKGEAVIPASQNKYSYDQRQSFSPVISISVAGDADERKIKRVVELALDESARQFRRSGFELVPGRA